MILLSCGGNKLNTSLGLCSIGTFNKRLHTYSRWCLKRSRCKLKYNLLYDGSNCFQHHPLGLAHFARFFSREAKKSYYDILRISPKSTQAQVKQAYYDLSKKFHPDQYKGKQDAAVIFREITEAYEVLGNFQKRRMYDKGILNMGVAATPEEAEDYSSKFYQSRSKRSKMPTATGRTTVYNFDEWTKQHYEASFDRKNEARMRYAHKIRNAEEVKAEQKSHAALYVILLVALALISQHTMKNEVDVPKPTKSSKRSES